MTDYLKCLKTYKNENTKCRIEAKAYLGCRMDKCVRVFPSRRREGERGGEISVPSCMLRFADIAPRLVFFFKRGLMERDDWENLGLDKVEDKRSPTSTSPSPQPPPPPSPGPTATSSSR
jgi:hypothetical protein